MMNFPKLSKTGEAQQTKRIPEDYEKIVSRAAEQIRNGTNMRRDGRAEQIIRAAIIEVVGLFQDEQTFPNI